MNALRQTTNAPRRRSPAAAAFLLCLCATLSAPALADSATEGVGTARIGVSLVIPPRVSVETIELDRGALCADHRRSEGLLHVVDESGEDLPTCGMSRETQASRPGLRRLTVTPV